MPLASDIGVVSVLDVVERIYGIAGYPRGDEYAILCINPKHPESKPSCSVNLTTGLWKCLGCGAQGDLVGMGKIVMKRTREEILDMLTPGTPEALLVTIQQKLARHLGGFKRVAKIRIPPPEQFEDGPFDEVICKRFLTENTLRNFGVRYVKHLEIEGRKSKFTIQKSIAIPIRDSEGHILTWCYGRTAASPQWQPKYIYHPGVDIAPLWFGLDRVVPRTPVTVVEGAMDAMWMSQCGFPALALLGSQMVNRKLLRLTSYSRVTGFGDRDMAGTIAIHAMGKMIGGLVPFRVALYRRWMLSKRPNDSGGYDLAHDPEELPPVDVELAHAMSISWHEWSFRATRK